MKIKRMLNGMFHNYLVSIRDKQVLVLDEMFSKDFVGSYSVLDENVNSAKKLINQLTVDNKINFTRFYLTNNSIKVLDDEAKQSVYITALLAIDEENGFYPLLLGGKHIVHYQKEDNAWKIKSILFDLDWVKGNTGYLMNLNLIDYEKMSGHECMICSEYDSPWQLVDGLHEDITDEEKMIDTIYKLNFGIDYLDIHLVIKSLTENVQIIVDGVELANSKRDVIRLIKSVLKTELPLQHALTIKTVSSETLEVEGYRLQLHRIKSKSYNNATKNTTFYNARVTYSFSKERFQYFKINKIEYMTSIIPKEVIGDIITDKYDKQFYGRVIQ